MGCRIFRDMGQSKDKNIQSVEYLAFIIAAYYAELIRLGIPETEATIIAAALQDIIFEDMG